MDAHVYEGHVSSGLARPMFPIAWKNRIQQKTKTFGENKKASEYFDRMQEHLKENGLKLEIRNTSWEEPGLRCKSESIKGDEEANLANPGLRSPYVVPESVSGNPAE